MSLKEWEMKFYPKSAAQIVAEGATEEELLEHALLKWKGLRKEEREAYGLQLSSRLLYEESNTYADFFVDGHSCSLCEAYNSSCFKCPIGQFLPHRLRLQEEEEACLYEYWKLLHKGDPEPMISLLERVLAWVKGGKCNDSQTS